MGSSLGSAGLDPSSRVHWYSTAPVEADPSSNTVSPTSAYRSIPGTDTNGCGSPVELLSATPVVVNPLDEGSSPDDTPELPDPIEAEPVVPLVAPPLVSSAAVSSPQPPSNSVATMTERRTPQPPATVNDIVNDSVTALPL